MKNDHIIHFINTKGKPVDEIGKELVIRKTYNSLRILKGPSDIF